MDQYPQEPFGSTEPPGRQAPPDPLVPDIVERRSTGHGAYQENGSQYDDRDGVGTRLFGPRSFAGGRVQVYGCSPGCLVVSLIVSVLASVVLTLLFNALF